jgi:hypothetical protein
VGIVERSNGKTRMQMAKRGTRKEEEEKKTRRRRRRTRGRKRGRTRSMGWQALEGRAYSGQ